MCLKRATLPSAFPLCHLSYFADFLPTLSFSISSLSFFTIFPLFLLPLALTPFSPFHFPLTQCHPFFLSAPFLTLPFYLSIPSPTPLAPSITLMFSVPSPPHIASSITSELSSSPHSFTNKRFWFCTAASRIEQNGT